MGRLTDFIGRFGRDERGATAIEYGLIAALIAVAISTTVWTLGTQVRVILFERIADNLNF